MKHFLFFILSLIYLTSFSQTQPTEYYNQKISSAVYTLIDPNSKLNCCTDSTTTTKKWVHELTYNYTTETNCFDDFNCLDDYYFFVFQNDDLIDTLAKDISKFYFKSLPESKRKSFTKSCWNVDKQVIIEDNMSEGEDWTICATTYLKITFYFQ